MKIFKKLMYALLVQSVALAVPVSARAEVFSTTYYHNDILGSPVAATDQDGDLLWREEYKPYGERILNEQEAADNSRWYTGHPHDPETGLTYAGARYYDPIVGRFMGIDPVGFIESNPTSFNRYAYANNNPYRYIDPDGEHPIAWLAVIGLEVLNLTLEASEPPPPGCENSCVVVSGFGFPGSVGKVTATKLLDDAAIRSVNLLKITEKQFGKKLAKHFKEFGLDPSNPSHRTVFRDMINDIANNADKVVEGSFRGQSGVKFFIKGKNVVVSKLDNEFVTILKDGISNPSVQRALGNEL